MGLQVLAFHGSAHGADRSTGTAADASISIDFVTFFAFRDSADGAFAFTSTALDAIFADNISHDMYLQKLQVYTCCIYLIIPIRTDFVKAFTPFHRCRNYLYLPCGVCVCDGFGKRFPLAFSLLREQLQLHLPEAWAAAFWAWADGRDVPA